MLTYASDMQLQDLGKRLETAAEGEARALLAKDALQVALLLQKYLLTEYKSTRLLVQKHLLSTKVQILSFAAG